MDQARGHAMRKASPDVLPGNSELLNHGFGAIGQESYVRALSHKRPRQIKGVKPALDNYGDTEGHAEKQKSESRKLNSEAKRRGQENESKNLFASMFLPFPDQGLFVRFWSAND